MELLGDRIGRPIPNETECNEYTLSESENPCIGRSMSPHVSALCNGLPLERCCDGQKTTVRDLISPFPAINKSRLYVPTH